MIFSRRNKLMVRKKLPPKLKVMGKELNYSNQHKNLGITFDRKLTYKAHLKDRMSKARGILIQLSNSMGMVAGRKSLILTLVAMIPSSSEAMTKA